MNRGLLDGSEEAPPPPPPDYESDRLNPLNHQQDDPVEEPQGHEAFDFPGIGLVQESINTQKIRECFPLKERISMNMCSCFSRRRAGGPNDFPLAVNQFKAENEGKTLKLKIEESSSLEPNPNIIHPFVRVHFIDEKTGQLIQKNPDVSGGAVNFLEYETRKLNGVYSSKESELIPGFSTKCCDLRDEKKSRAIWNEEILLNVDACDIISQNMVMVFELLDFSFQCIAKKSPELNFDKHFRIAWGYLRLAGISGNHLGEIRVQLYQFKFNSQKYAKNNPQMPRTYLPEVFFDFSWPKKEKYPGYIQIELRTAPPPKRPLEVEILSIHPFEIERGDPEMVNQPKRSKEEKKKDEEFDEKFKAKQRRLNRIRWFEGTSCDVADTIWNRLDSAPLGCLCMAFSISGRYLAAACTQKNSHTFIRIIDVEEQSYFREKEEGDPPLDVDYHLKGHIGLIHDLQWFGEWDELLFSAGADKRVNVWRLPSGEFGSVAQEIIDSTCLVSSLNHPSYVYKMAFHPDSRPDEIFLITACYDGKVRFYSLKFSRDQTLEESHMLLEETVDYAIARYYGRSGVNGNEYLNNNPSEAFEERVYPNSMVIDQVSRLYIGDSVGTVHIWEVSCKYGSVSVVKLSLIQHEEISGDIINHLILRPVDQTLIVHTRDNCIRHIQTRSQTREGTFTIYDRFYGAKFSRNNIRCDISPDGQFLMTGSETGEVVMWSLDGAIQMSTAHFEVKFHCQSMTTSWNPKYNMIAVSAFGYDFPILIYTNLRDSEEEFDKLLQEMNAKSEKRHKIDENNPPPPPPDSPKPPN